MGNNQAFTDFEHIVILLYNERVLDKSILSKIMEHYRGWDIDRGGMRGTLSTDGFNIEQIVLKAFGYELPIKPLLPSDYETWTEEQYEQNDTYNETTGLLFNEITDKFGWE